MQLIKVATGTLNQTPLDWRGNAQRILAAIEQAREQAVSLLCLPELCISGYGCEDAFQAAGTAETSLRVLTDEIVQATRGLIVSVGLPLSHNNALFSTACLIADGRILGFVAKQALAGSGIHYEPRWFRAWPRGQRGELAVGGQTLPFGDLYFDVGGVKIGFEICEDAWGATRPGVDLALSGVDIILNPSASHFAFGKQAVRERIVLEGSRAFGVSYLYANLVGNEAGRAIYDGGALIASAGTMLAIGRRFSYQDLLLTTAVIDIDATVLQRARVGGVPHDPTARSASQVSASFSYTDVDPVTDGPVRERWELGESLKEEEFTRALALALYDYLRKSRSEGFVISLSGGADSAAVACLTALMVRLGTAELGEPRFLEKLSHAARLQGARGPRALVEALTTCVYQATRNSSSTTRAAARSVAEAVGARYLELEVDPLVDGYVERVERALGTELDWERHDIALQNIQARARAPSVWLIANIQNALLLATSNRSEAAVGYATMDGDTCGGLSPIAGIDKAFLLRWLGWLEREGPQGLGPIAELAAVNSQQPTAELRPASAAQTDEDDLMPYELLDSIERAAIRDKQTPLEVFRVMRKRFPEHATERLGRWVELFFALWCRNQWKRERYAPSFHLDDANLDPKSWCRFPILSGGFARELDELRAYVASLPGATRDGRG